MTFRVATYNAGLAVGYLPHVTERVPHVIDALAALDVDVLFVQELWLDEHWAQLRERLRPTFPHALRPAAIAPPTPSCSETQLAPLVACAKTHCGGLRDEPLARCVVEHCAKHGLALPAGCLNCIASEIRGSIEDIATRCVGSVATESARGGYAALLAYGGSFGTGLLSRAPLESPDELVYLATINARGAVYARTQGMHVFATHFSPGGAEQPPQVDALVRWVDTHAPRGEPAILLGDLNTTAGSALFGTLERAGFREPDVLDRRSTFNHGLGNGHVRDDGWRIDHVLVRDVADHVTSRRILDAPVTLASGVRTTLSDHFGVLATIDRR